MAYFIFIKGEAPDSSWALLEMIPNSIMAAKATRDYRWKIGGSVPNEVRMVEAESEDEARAKLDPTDQLN